MNQKINRFDKKCRLVFIIIGIALMVSIGLVGTASAENDQALSPVVDGVVRDGLYSPKDGIADVIMANVVVQVLDVERESLPFEDKGILEFDVSTLSGPIISATLDLSVYSSNGPYPFNVDVFTYTGDGILSLNDFNTGTLFHTFEYSGDETVQLDVTPFIKSIVSSGDQYVGFNFQFAEPSTIPMNGPFVAFNSLEYPPAATLTILSEMDYVVSSDNTGKEQNTFDLTENVYCYAGNLPVSTDVRIYVVANKDTWNDGDALLNVSVGYQRETTESDGSITTTEICSAPLTEGEYDIVVDTNQNGKWNTGEPVDSYSCVDVGFTEIPEFTTIAIPVGAVLGLVFLMSHRRRDD